MLTPRQKSPLLSKFSPEEDRTHDAASSRTVSLTHYQSAIPAPLHYSVAGWGVVQVYSWGSNVTVLHQSIEGSRPECCISSMKYSRDTPFWLETLGIYSMTDIQQFVINDHNMNIWSILTNRNTWTKKKRFTFSAASGFSGFLSGWKRKASCAKTTNTMYWNNCLVYPVTGTFMCVQRH